MVKSKKQIDNYTAWCLIICLIILIIIKLIKKPSPQQQLIFEQQQQLSFEGQLSIEASVATATTTTNQYTKAREWINENVMDWVEFEKIKMAIKESSCTYKGWSGWYKKNGIWSV